MYLNPLGIVSNMPDSGAASAAPKEVRSSPLPSMFARYRDGFVSHMKGSVPGYDTSAGHDGSLDGLYHMLSYHLGWSDSSGRPVDGEGSQGKALRPTLCLFACESLGGNWSQARPAASALEMVHNFSLVHDDIQDGDLERRHQPTVWSLWGQSQALVSGNALRSVADQTALELAELGVPTSKALKATQILTNACLEMIQGQCLDLSFERRLDIGPTDYLDMVSRKTGSLISCALQMGALVATDDASPIRFYGEAGQYLGLAFQVRDDVLGIWGDESTTGKAAGNDILRRKKSFPVVYALETCTSAARQRLFEIYNREDLTEQDVADVMMVLEEVGAESYSQRTAEERASLALEQVRKISLETWAFHEFEELVSFLAIRHY